MWANCSRRSVRGATDVRYSTFAPRFAHPPSLKATAWLAAKNYSQALTRLVLIGFCPAHDQSAAKEFLVVQLLHGAFRFLDGLHLHKGKTFRALVVPVTYHLCILHVPYAVEQFKEIALGRVEGQVANVKTRRSDFDAFRFTRWSRRLRAIAWLRCGFAFLPAVSKKFGNPLPECLFLRLPWFLPAPKTSVVPSAASAPTARAA